MQTFGEIIKLGDLPIEEKAMIKDSIIYSAEHESEFYADTNKEKLDANKTSMTFTRSYLPKIDKTSDRYKHGLVEGVTPEPEQINEAEFSVPVIENGWFYRFTNKALNHAWTDIRTKCSKNLQNVFKTYHDEKIADAYLSVANVVTSCDLLSLEDLLRLQTILYKNNAVAFEGGFYKLKVAPEVAAKMLVTYKDIITHTTESNAVVDGEIGEIAGFRVIKSRLQAFAKGTSGYPFVAYGKTQKDEYPVSICSYDDTNAEIIFTELGGLGNDPLKQRGAISLHLDGHAFYVFDDSIAVRGTQSATGITAVDAFDDDKRSHLVRANTAASNINVNASVLNLKVGETFDLVATDGDGNELSDVTYTSLDAKVASVATAKVTAVKAGVTSIVAVKGTLSTVVVVNVIAA